MSTKSAIRRDVITLKRERILETAVELFYSRGFENTTLDAVADELDVRKPYIYSYFESKQELLAQICEKGVGEALSTVMKIIDQEGPPTGHLRAICEATVVTVIRFQKHNVIWAREEKNLLPKHAAKLNRMRRKFDDGLHRVLEAGQKSGEFRIADTRLATLAIGGLCTSVQVWYREGGRLKPADVAAGLADLAMTMVQAK